jgi:hypothetical protein
MYYHFFLFCDSRYKKLSQYGTFKERGNGVLNEDRVARFSATKCVHVKKLT